MLEGKDGDAQKEVLKRVVDSAARREQEKKELEEMRKERAAKAAAAKKAPKLQQKTNYQNPDALLEQAKVEREERQEKLKRKLGKGLAGL